MNDVSQLACLQLNYCFSCCTFVTCVCNACVMFCIYIKNYKNYKLINTQPILLQFNQFINCCGGLLSIPIGTAFFCHGVVSNHSHSILFANICQQVVRRLQHVCDCKKLIQDTLVMFDKVILHEFVFDSTLQQLFCLMSTQMACYMLLQWNKDNKSFLHQTLHFDNVHNTTNLFFGCLSSHFIS